MNEGRQADLVPERTDPGQMRVLYPEAVSARGPITRNPRLWPMKGA
jgi:hypothetical protein